jgi:hypothetical protein
MRLVEHVGEAKEQQTKAREANQAVELREGRFCCPVQTQIKPKETIRPKGFQPINISIIEKSNRDDVKTDHIMKVRGIQATNATFGRWANARWNA